MESAERKLGNLFIVGTPIGNLKDITLRAIETLQTVDFLVVEDTRITIKLLNHLQIKKPMISYFRHSNNYKIDLIIEKLKGGENAAIVSDAGMPCISDPGKDLVSACIIHEINVIPIPGVNAAISGLVVSGCDASRFCFEGFLPLKKKNRQQRLNELQQEKRTIILYEAPHKLVKTLKDIGKQLGDNRQICLARELTKLHEQVLRLSIKEAINYFEITVPKGEFVLILEGNNPD